MPMTSLERAYEQLNAERNRQQLGSDIRVVALTTDELRAVCETILASLSDGQSS